jgi:response regulator NasT
MHSGIQQQNIRVAIGGDEARLCEACDIIRCLGHEIVSITDTATEIVRAVLLHQPDILLFEFRCSPGLGVLRQIYQEHSIPSVVIVDKQDEPEIRAGLRDFALTYVVNPISERALAAALSIAMARHEAERELSLENERLKTQLENRKVIEKAKGVLMTRYRWSENDAFRRLQRSAMNHRTSMARLAQDVLSGATVNL